jgi:hypothetical protein
VIGSCALEDWRAILTKALARVAGAAMVEMLERKRLFVTFAD